MTIGSRAGSLDITIEQGVDFDLPCWWKDENETAIDLTGWTARMHIRDRYNVALLHELTTENGGIAIVAVDGKITLSISAIDSDAFTWRYGKYDLEMIDGVGDVMRLLEGNVIVSAQVTRS